MLFRACAYGVKSEISLDTGDSASNAVVKHSVYINQRCAECVCLYTMDFVSAGKDTLLLLLLYVTACEKIVPRLNKHDDVIEWKSMKISLTPNEELVAPLNQAEQFLMSFTWKNVSALGLLHMFSRGCCDNTLLCKTPSCFLPSTYSTEH